MRNIDSNLFKEYQIDNQSALSVVGGLYTSVGSDTNDEGGGYDIIFETLDSSGSSQGNDTHNTGTTNRDQPDIK